LEFDLVHASVDIRVHPKGLLEEPMNTDGYAKADNELNDEPRFARVAPYHKLHAVVLYLLHAFPAEKPVLNLVVLDVVPVLEQQVEVCARLED